MTRGKQKDKKRQLGKTWWYTTVLEHPLLVRPVITLSNITRPTNLNYPTTTTHYTHRQRHIIDRQHFRERVFKRKYGLKTRNEYKKYTIFNQKKHNSKKLRTIKILVTYSFIKYRQKYDYVSSIIGLKWLLKMPTLIMKSTLLFQKSRWQSIQLKYMD